MNNQTPKSRMHYGLKTMASLCRGNTLVPVIIALSISSVAAIAFLKQGAEVRKDMNMLKAPDEIIEIAQELKNLRKTKSILNITKSDVTANGKNNVFGQVVIYIVADPTLPTAQQKGKIWYATDYAYQCQQLANILSGHPDITEICCDCESPGSTLTNISFFLY